MSNVTAPLLLPVHASGGAFDWASSALEGMRAGAHFLTQPLTTLSDFLTHDPGHMGGCVSSAAQQHSRVDDEGYIVTDWKLHTTQHHDSQPVDSAHIITRNPAGVAFSQQPRDGAHILSSWRGDGLPAAPGHSEKEEQEEDIPLQLDPTDLLPGEIYAQLPSDAVKAERLGRRSTELLCHWFPVPSLEEQCACSITSQPCLFYVQGPACAAAVLGVASVSSNPACKQAPVTGMQNMRAAGEYLPELSEESGLLSDEDVRALAAAVPIRHRWCHWRLLYSTARDGTSLQTLYRAALHACTLVHHPLLHYALHVLFLMRNHCRNACRYRRLRVSSKGIAHAHIDRYPHVPRGRWMTGSDWAGGRRWLLPSCAERTVDDKF